MTLFLGIDGGGSGCRAAVADAVGPRARAGARPARPTSATDPEGARGNILAAAGAALAAAGRAPTGDLVAVLGLAGANVAGAAARLARGAALRARCGSRRDAVDRR